MRLLTMAATPRIEKSNLIGRHIIIIRYQGEKRETRGVIKDETRYTFTIDIPGRKRFLKESLVFRMHWRDREVEVEARVLKGRLMDRTKTN
ncbi:MAG: ribonuclease P protein subunit [archaeon]